jgi:hypothetical protein
MQEIAFCNDPHKATLIIKNGKASLIGFEQQARGIDERHAQLHSCKRGSHDIGGTHDWPSCWLRCGAKRESAGLRQELIHRLANLLLADACGVQVRHDASQGDLGL